MLSCKTQMHNGTYSSGNLLEKLQSKYNLKGNDKEETFKRKTPKAYKINCLTNSLIKLTE